jgi:hemerythrin superfamily protein
MTREIRRSRQTGGSDPVDGHRRISQLLEDRRHIEQLLSNFDTRERAMWPDSFCELILNLVRHEVAEEEVIYPRVRKTLPTGTASPRLSP